MEGNYPLLYGKSRVGEVTVTRQGLYYRFDCRCTLEAGKIVRIRVRWGAAEENLGIPMPQGNAFSLVTRLPVRRFSDGTPEFWVDAGEPPENFYPVAEGKPFAAISLLRHGRFLRQNGQPGIVVDSTSSTGQ